jgi:hypothetical protein
LFTLDAEPGTVFNLNAPTSTTLTGTGGNLNVTLTPSLATGSHTMVPGGIGLGYGAEITVTSGTASGTYTGSVLVSIGANHLGFGNRNIARRPCRAHRDLPAAA